MRSENQRLNALVAIVELLWKRVWQKAKSAFEEAKTTRKDLGDVPIQLDQWGDAV